MECWISHVRASHWKGECTGIQCLDVSEAQTGGVLDLSCTSFSLEG